MPQSETIPPDRLLRATHDPVIFRYCDACAYPLWGRIVFRVGLHDAMNEEDVRFREELKFEVQRCAPDEVDEVLSRVSKASKERQRAILKEHHFGETDPDRPRAA